MSKPDAKEFRLSLSLSQCEHDGLLQLFSPWPSEEVRPRLPWITYKEPERHLDDLCERIASLPGVHHDTFVAGLSYKDEPVLSRLEKKGFSRTWNVTLEDLGIFHSGAGMESIQSVLSPDLATSLRKKRGAPGVIIVRHLLEHSNSIRQTMDFLKAWAEVGAYFVFEVPDSEQTFRDLDLGTIWEEHVCYFTEFTLGQAFHPFGTDLLTIIRYPYTLEDCLVAFVVNRLPTTPLQTDAEGLAGQLSLGRTFRDGWHPLAKRCQAALKALWNKGEKAAIFGAGHRAATFVNLLGLGTLVNAVIDDDPRKIGLYLPGSQLPILPSSLLRERFPSLCLLAASPDSEAKIIAQHQFYSERGGSFTSIYPRSPLAWHPLSSLNGR